MKQTLQNDRFLRALRREPVDKTPVWIMRQAGRYLPEYLKIREKAGDFMTLCKTPEMACEVTLQPLARFDLDAGIIFSDILTIPDAMGLGLYFESAEGPVFKHPLQDAASIKKCQVPDMSDLQYVFDAIKVTQRELGGRLPLIGFAGSPWTLATYMVEGRSTKDFRLIKKLLYAEPTLLHHLLQILSDSVTAYLEEQINAGVNAVMIFDTWGGVLSTPAYLEFSLPYMQKTVASLSQSHPDTPVILFTKNGAQWLEAMANTGCAALGLDWTSDIKIARERVGNKVALQGNLDPAILYASPDRIRAEVKTVLTQFGKGPGHVFNLGHGIHRDVLPEHVTVLVDAVHEFGEYDSSN